MTMRVVVGLLILGLVMVDDANAITCQEAVLGISPCQSWLSDQYSHITPYCCKAVRILNFGLVTKEDRKAVCECFKQVGPTMGVDIDRARQIPKLCHLVHAVPLDYSADCDKV